MKKRAFTETTFRSRRNTLRAFFNALDVKFEDDIDSKVQFFKDLTGMKPTTYHTYFRQAMTTDHIHGGIPKGENYQRIQSAVRGFREEFKLDYLGRPKEQPKLPMMTVDMGGKRETLREVKPEPKARAAQRVDADPSTMAIVRSLCSTMDAASLKVVVDHATALLMKKF